MQAKVRFAEDCDSSYLTDFEFMDIDNFLLKIKTLAFYDNQSCNSGTYSDHQIVFDLATNSSYLEIIIT